MIFEYDDDTPTFEPNVNTKYGRGAARAINKGKVKRQIHAVHGSPTAPHHGKRNRRHR